MGARFSRAMRVVAALLMALEFVSMFLLARRARMTHRIMGSAMMALLSITMVTGGVQANSLWTSPALPPPTTHPTLSESHQSDTTFPADASAVNQFVVSSSQSGWQPTTIYAQPGQSFTISYVSGTWTVDFRKFPFVGPEGYSSDIDQQIYQGCKLDSSLPYGTLLSRVGQGAFLPIGRTTTFTANEPGYISFHIHDADGCLLDNSGAIIVAISPGTSAGNSPITTATTDPQPNRPGHLSRPGDGYTLGDGDVRIYDRQHLLPDR